MKCPKCDTDNPDTVKFCGECGTNITSADEAQPSITKTIETPREELKTGSTFAGRYQIIEELGKGGMGKVYRVLDKKLNEEVALKLIKPDIASDRNTVERFKNELKLARKIRQKNVGSMYELLEDKGIHFITMEYVSGQDLKGLIRQTGQLTVGKAISIAKQICDGLDEAHSLGVVHRDLKPNNIMIDRGGNAKIMDFGIARAVKGKSITGPGVMIGTPQYMSPEQVEGKEVDQRSDIYSLGIIIYEMLTDRVPFDGDTPLTVGVKQKTETPRDPMDFNERIPDDLNRLILKCLEKQRESRYENVDEIKAELGKLEQGLPTTDRVIPKKKTLPSKDITDKFNAKKVLIPAVVALAICISAIFMWRLFLATGSSKNSIAVLPFEDMSPGKDQGHLADGIPDILINALSRIEGLSVPGRTSSFSLRGEQDIEKIGQKLRVETLLEGSIQASGSNILVVVRLINVEDGFQIWSEEYQKTMDDIFSVQEDIAQSVVKALKVEFIPEKGGKLVRTSTENSEAYNLYLLGRHFWNKRTEEYLKKAIENFEKAIEVDPNYAMAYSGISDSYLAIPYYSYTPQKEVYPKAMAAALKALDLNELLAEAHTSLAWLKMSYEWDWQGAEREFKRAIELNPNYTTAHYWYAYCLLSLKRFDECFAELDRALELEPLSLVIRGNLGEMYYYTHQYDKALEITLKTLEMDPNFSLLHIHLGYIYLQKSMYEDALKEFQKGPYDFEIGITYAMMGNRADAQKTLYDLIKLANDKYFSAYEIATLYFLIDEEDQGFTWMRRALEEKDPYLIYLSTNPLLDDVRSDSRFKELLKTINLR
ncbi:protein kinase [Acidobacteriota bacterium]